MKDGTPIAGDPAAGTGNIFTLPSADFDPYVTFYIDPGSGSWTANFRSDHIVYPISGYPTYPTP
jgi:hypothetical protein